MVPFIELQREQIRGLIDKFDTHSTKPLNKFTFTYMPCQVTSLVFLRCQFTSSKKYVLVDMFVCFLRALRPLPKIRLTLTPRRFCSYQNTHQTQILTSCVAPHWIKMSNFVPSACFMSFPTFGTCSLTSCRGLVRPHVM